ncbi:MAG: Hsp20/alpha crystallin family protein [Gammaproteobacteria bacterium]|nr:Hsp20/alpha crystallin family protein [Gammaproteobacteria bacterium]MBL7000406.1 Hsp20/alpha crystallin family protein [Gammaproteobacteria bacterium]
MSNDNTMNLQHSQQQTALAGQANAEVFTLRPLTDIHETSQGVTLYLDMPGVTKDALSIDIDQNVLSIRGSINLHTPENLKPSHMELHSGIYERRFTLGDELGVENIEANLNQGELKLFIPRSEQHKPRKIDIKVV